MEFVLGVIVAVVATPLAAALARRLGVVDRPGPLKTQQRPVPYLGGLAVFAALVVGVVAAGRTALLAPLALALILGIVDDVRPVPARVRFALELAIGALAGVAGPGPVLVRAGTALLVVVLLNAVNLLDGQDGLAASVGLVAALGLAVLGGDARPFALALAGGLAGFLVFNRPPARVYLGDGGAYLLGTALALAVPLTAGGTGHWSVWFAAPLLVAVPVVDTAVAVWRRLRTHHPLFVGDRSHVYDQLVDRGLSVGWSTLACALAQIGFSALGVLAAGLDAPVALAVTVVVAVSTGLGAWALRLA